MELLEAIQRRYSVRAFWEKPVDDAALQSILKAANDAPSAGNKQAYEIVVVRDEGRKRQLVKASSDQSFIAQASAVLVFLTNPARNSGKYGHRGAELYSLQDATVACAYAQLAATALGLGTCWVGAFDEEAVRQVVGGPAMCRPVAILPVGEPAEPAKPHERRPVTDLVHDEQLRRPLL